MAKLAYGWSPPWLHHKNGARLLVENINSCGWYFFLQEFRKWEGLNSWDWRSLCSHQVPMKFSMCSYQVPYAFRTCSQCVCNLFPDFLVCVPQYILDRITLYPITFAQSWILITNVGGQKDNTLIIPFKEPNVLFGEVS